MGEVTPTQELIDPNKTDTAMQNGVGSTSGSVPSCVVWDRLLPPPPASFVKSGDNIWLTYYWVVVRTQ